MSGGSGEHTPRVSLQESAPTTHLLRGQEVENREALEGFGGGVTSGS